MPNGIRKGATYCESNEITGALTHVAMTDKKIDIYTLEAISAALNKVEQISIYKEMEFINNVIDDQKITINALEEKLKEREKTLAFFEEIIRTLIARY